MTAHLLALGLLALAATSAGAGKPHIVFFLADDYGFADVSYHTKMYGNSSNVVATPNLDRLAMSGVRLENYYVQPVCSPTRSSFMTGRYTVHTGINTPLVDSSPSGLRLEEVTIAQKMKEAGYQTHMIGKWHLGFYTPAHTPTQRGFDTFYGYYAGSQDYYNHQSLCWAGKFENGCFQNTTKTGEAVTGLDLHDGLTTANSSEYSTILYTDKFKEIIADYQAGGSDEPLFMYLPHQAVHVGNAATKSHPEYWLDQAPQKYIDEYSWVPDEERRNLSAMITVMDEAAGNVTQALKDAGMWEDTLFIFSTDNGGPLFHQASNYPLRGGKATLWEGGVRGVGFITGAGIPAALAGSVNEQMIHVSDWLPTLCEVAGCDLNGTLPLDGVSAWPTITTNKTGARTEIIHEVLTSDHYAVRSGDYKLISGQSGEGKKQPQLFNVRKDVAETTDLSGKYPAKVEELQELMEVYLKSAIPPQDGFPPDPASNPNLHGGVWVPWRPNEE